MPGRRLPTVDIRTLLLQIRSNPSDRALSRLTGMHRTTIHAYRQWAKEQNLLTDPLLPLEELQKRREQTLSDPLPPQNQSSVEPFREIVVKLRRENVCMTTILKRLKERGYTGAYASVYRFVKVLEPVLPDVCVRVETQPAEEAQVDFGEVGRLPEKDGKRPRVYAFVMTLSWSRHQYLEFVTDQKVETWLALHVRAFAFFGGVPQRIVCDNLKAAIVRAAFDDPTANRAYAECAEHYGFRIAPCRPRTPEHKGKVERGIAYVQGSFWAGRDWADLPTANAAARIWCLGDAGERTHGTTKEQPLARFEGTERERLLPLPRTPYDMAVMKQTRIYRDCYFILDDAYYSAPFRLVGQKLWVRGGLSQVRLYDRAYQLVATHERAKKPGERLTHPDHLPAHKLPGLLQTRESCREEAGAVGAATLALVERLLEDPILDRLPTAGRLVRLQGKYSPERLEAACARALRFEDPSYTTVKRILHQGLENAALPAPPVAVSSEAFAFVRPVEEIFGNLVGGMTWN
jgi:transposase